MFDYKKRFRWFCRDHDLDLVLSFDMPAGYEDANGTFDAEERTVYINAGRLKEAPDYERAFFLFHELRHALQYLRPELFSEAVGRSIRYVIMYDGTCYRMIGGRYRECRLEGSEEFFRNLYLGQPHEADANAFAYEKAREICGDSEGLRDLYEVWTPQQAVTDEIYDSVYDAIDEKAGRVPDRPEEPPEHSVSGSVV